MESQYQDDLPVEWFEFTFSLPSELEMQMQDDYGDQGHIQQGYDMMATDYLQSPPTQEPQCAIATEGFINNFDLVHNFLPQDLGLFSTGLENYPMEPPNLESISPGVSTVTDWTLPSSSSSSDGYDGSANSPGLFTNALYGLPMTNMPVITSQSLVVAPVLLDNNITMTSNTGVGPQTLLEQQPYEQPSHVVTRASSQQLAGMSLPPETPSSSQPGIHRPPKKKTKRPTISERERRKKERPEKCPECDKGFPYVADLDRHIVARHEPEAPKYGLSTEKILCDLCLPSAAKSFARPDHLKRHKRRKHGKGRSRGPSLSSRSRSPTVKISGDSLALEGGRPALKRLRPRGS